MNTTLFQPSLFNFAAPLAAPAATTATAPATPTAGPAMTPAYINPPFNYTGSKFGILDQILPLFDYTKPYFIDLFSGGGSVYSNVATRFERVVANDIIGDLMQAHRLLITQTDEFVAKVRACCVAKDDQEGYHRLRDAYNAEKTPERLFALMLCCNCNMLRFNRKFEFNQTFGKRTFNESTAVKIAAWTGHMRPLVARVKYLSRSFTNIWPGDPAHTMFYSDSPYHNSEAGYNAYWSEQQEDFLYDYIIRVDEAGGSFALSGLAGEHGDHGESRLIRRLIEDGFNLTIIRKDYDKVAKVKGKGSQEVLLRNFG